MTVAAPPRRRLEPDERREQILRCAIRLFGERPYAAVSTTEIAAEAGVARGLVNHYFGTKRELYLVVVRRMLRVPSSAAATVPRGSLRRRVQASVDWFLDSVSPHVRTWVAVIGTEGVGSDPDVEAILAEADEIAVDQVLAAVGLDDCAPGHEQRRAMVRAYGAMVKAATREWLVRETLSRDELRLLLTQSLVSLVRDTFPQVPGQPNRAARCALPGAGRPASGVSRK
ncbi:MAG: TetR/AcrR family transcriptional regulator [Pseudonocardiales bacterium]|nr:MAG: TetR/AcrR family transcriptional regulator [Pseudonocardiales bacterium]